MLSYVLILAAYLIGTFYLQRLNRFGRKMRGYFASLLLYAAAFIIPAMLLPDSLLSALFFVLIVLATHAVYFIGQSDLITARPKGLAAFVCTHMLIAAALLLAVYFFFTGNAAFADVTDALLSLFGDNADTYLYFVLSVLICLAPSSEFVRVTMDHFCPNYASEGTSYDHGGLGSTIGMFERVIIMITGFMGWYVAIAFVVTAKSLARFKQFEDPDFVERFIIGTFSSILVPLVLLFIMTQIF
ncbi:MAG: hypothetical protein FWC29_02555 [Methanomassiliicoccaceae archaeon]|nr:hypothetical protein [Methanomassiliicoccaceae archaeon]